jgi:hypothetical protein
MVRLLFMKTPRRLRAVSSPGSRKLGHLFGHRTKWTKKLAVTRPILADDRLRRVTKRVSAVVTGSEEYCTTMAVSASPS